ncbi:MAG: hybrid sensor histidine kinase/response regulator [Deltaproteobacteria bacterium]|nr:hybrid sensor histidine kinase/response regulator [Deltaproteobacteria bacterium]
MGHVLCVDDDRAALATLTRALRTVAPVVAAASVEDARAALGPEIAAVVSDYRMPGTLGTALLAEVRERDATIGRILLTAYVDADVLMGAINEGHVHRYLTKPWDPRELRAAVGQAIAGAYAERERRRLAGEMVDAYARLRALDEMKTRVVTLAAHELRTPLHVLAGTLEALAVHVSAAAARPLLETARRNLAWLGRGVRAMTDLARFARTAPPRAVPLCLATLARRAVEEVAPFCAARHLELATTIPERAPARGDAADVHHALMNLLLNAVRFTPDGGRIAVAVRSAADGTTRLSVADSGIGIATAARARIGEPFFTAAPLHHHHSDPIAFRSGGVGLGVAVARAIAEAHGGRLTFESEEGRGTTFVLEIPSSD